MPNNFFSVDSRFPNIKNKTQEQINDELVNYLFLLLEQLRYTMSNLGASNFNDTELDVLSMTISDPIYKRIEDTEGNVTAIQITAEGLTQRVENAEGDIDTLTVTADGLVNRVSDAEGNISALTQTSASLSSRISDNEGNISALTQTSASLSSRISDNEGNISALTQTSASMASRISDTEGNISALTQTSASMASRISDAEGNISALTQSSSVLDARVSDAEGNIAAVSLSASSLEARVGQNELSITNLGIQLAGKVTFADLSTAGSTVINGSNITTGKISAINIESSIITGSYFETNTDSYGRVMVMYDGTIRTYWEGTMIGNMFYDIQQVFHIYSYGGIQIDSALSFATAPTYAKTYSFLHEGNINSYISTNAATIRGLLGL